MKINSETIGTAGQVTTVAEDNSAAVTNRWKKYLGFAFIGVVLVFVSSYITLTVVNDKSVSANVAGSGAATVSRPAVETKSAAGSRKTLLVVPGPFSRDEITDMALSCVGVVMRQETYDDHILRRMEFEEGLSSIKCLEKEKGMDENGVERNIYPVDVHLVGTYRSIITNKTRPFNISLLAHVAKVEYGKGYKVLGDPEVTTLEK